jgi:aminopeptidase N
VKLTYTADIEAPSEYNVLMSAIGNGEVASGKTTVYSFDQKTTIPTYLIAIAVGNIVGKRIGPRKIYFELIFRINRFCRARSD